MPASVEICGELMVAKLALQEATLHWDGCDESKVNMLQLRLLLSTALIRFVNIMTESVRRGQLSKPVHVLARELGVAEWLVELRHDATHAALPDLETLRAGVEYALQWLQQNYWQIEVDRLGDVSLPSQLYTDTVADTLNLYKRLVTSNTIGSPNNRTSITKISSPKRKFGTDTSATTGGCGPPSQQQLTRVLKQCDELLSESADSCAEFVHTLSRAGYLVTTTAPQQRQQDVVGGGGGGGGGEMRVDGASLQAWAPLLRRLHHHHHILTLVQQLAYNITSEEGKLRHLYAHTATAWILQLLYSISNHDIRKMDTLKFELSQDIDWLNMLSLLLARPHGYTLQLLQGVIPLVRQCGARSVSDGQLSEVESLVQTLTVEGPDHRHGGAEPVGAPSTHAYTVHDLTHAGSSPNDTTHPHSPPAPDSSGRKRKWTPHIEGGSLCIGAGGGSNISRHYELPSSAPSSSGTVVEGHGMETTAVAADRSPAAGIASPPMPPFSHTSEDVVDASLSVFSSYGGNCPDGNSESALKGAEQGQATRENLRKNIDTIVKNITCLKRVKRK